MKDNELQFDRSCHVLYSKPCKKQIQQKIALHYPTENREAVWEKVQRQYVDFISDWRTDLGGKKNFHNGAGGNYDCVALMAYYVVCKEAREAVAALHDCGFTNVVMMTGDNRRTAEAVAAEVGVDAVYSEVLPEDKAAFIRSEKEKGHTVIMVGDGVNDSPALSEADAGIAISTGAAIAREIADITIASEDLFELVTLRRLSEALMKRIHGSYRFIVGFNLSLILLGVAGILPPTTSALLHNTSTLCISLQNMTNLLDKAEE